jgi:hypothetical protein
MMTRLSVSAVSDGPLSKDFEDFPLPLPEPCRVCGKRKLEALLQPARW